MCENQGAHFQGEATLFLSLATVSAFVFGFFYSAAQFGAYGLPFSLVSFDWTEVLTGVGFCGLALGLFRVLWGGIASVLIFLQINPRWAAVLFLLGLPLCMVTTIGNYLPGRELHMLWLCIGFLAVFKSFIYLNNHTRGPYSLFSSRFLVGVTAIMLWLVFYAPFAGRRATANQRIYEVNLEGGEAYMACKLGSYFISADRTLIPINQIKVLRQLHGNFNCL